MPDDETDRVVLIVEQDGSTRDDLCRMLRPAGWHVLEAATAETALEFMRSFSNIHILVVGVDLGEKRAGWDVADAYRVLNHHGYVIYTSDPIEDRSRAVPSSLLFIKPFDPPDVRFVCDTLRDSQIGARKSPGPTP